MALAYASCQSSGILCSRTTVKTHSRLFLEEHVCCLEVVKSRSKKVKICNQEIVTLLHFPAWPTPVKLASKLEYPPRGPNAGAAHVSAGKGTHNSLHLRNLAASERLDAAPYC